MLSEIATAAEARNIALRKTRLPDLGSTGGYVLDSIKQSYVEGSLSRRCYSIEPREMQVLIEKGYKIEELDLTDPSDPTPRFSKYILVSW
jgi:hypothetical protein